MSFDVKSLFSNNYEFNFYHIEYGIFYELIKYIVYYVLFSQIYAPKSINLLNQEALFFTKN